MSYDFWLEIDTGGAEPLSIEPRFDDQHPALHSDGYAGNVLVTERGYTRCGNYTSNVSPIWSRCLTAVAETMPAWREWMGDDDRAMARRRPDWKIDTEHLCLADLEGKPCRETADLLSAAVEWGTAHLAELEQLNPENGWGDARGAITYLWDIQRMCEKHPNATLRFSY